MTLALTPEEVAAIEAQNDRLFEVADIADTPLSPDALRPNGELVWQHRARIAAYNAKMREERAAAPPGKIDKRTGAIVGLAPDAFR